MVFDEDRASCTSTEAQHQEVLNIDSSFVAGEMGMAQQQITNSCLGRPHSCTDVKEAFGKLRVRRMGSVQVFCQRC